MQETNTYNAHYMRQCDSFDIKKSLKVHLLKVSEGSLLSDLFRRNNAINTS